MDPQNDLKGRMNAIKHWKVGWLRYLNLFIPFIEKQWNWNHADGSLESVSGFQCWSPGQPDHESEKCAVTSAGGNGWANYDCDVHNFRFLCQILKPELRGKTNDWDYYLG